jgi:glycosyltransferase involved in cell wall biosynthesis
LEKTVPFCRRFRERQVKVTVLVFAYNQIHFIRPALDSALAQKTDFEFEILINDDCSTDGTREVVQEYAAAHAENIRLLLSPVRLGDGRIADRGLKDARGEYIAFLDGDDYWTSPYKLQKQVALMDEHPEYSGCWHYQEYVDAEDKRMQDQPPHGLKSTWSLEDILKGRTIGTSSALLRHSMLPPLPDWYFLCPFGDFVVWVLCLQNGSAGYLDDSLGVYRIHAGGLYSGLNEITQKLLFQRTFGHVYRHLSPAHQSQVAEMYARRWATVALKQSLKGDYRGARKTAREAQQDFPHDMRLKLLAYFPMLYPPLRSLWLGWKHLCGRRVQDEV